MSKQVKYVVAVALKKSSNSKYFLIVKRPDNDPDLGGHWGLPAVRMKKDELPEQAAQRVCAEKLNCKATATRFMGIMYQKRNSYNIFLVKLHQQSWWLLVSLYKTLLKLRKVSARFDLNPLYLDTQHILVFVWS